MPRKLRLEFPGACYHVINRGNYRSHVFGTEGAGQAFEACLFEACEKSGWLLHAYVVMGNHFHLAVETPHGNLVAGMQWLQATFANRFNRLRGERGHLFQGRYKSLLVEEGEWLGALCHYIHLNPVRANLTTVEQLRAFRYSSYWYLWKPNLRPKFLRVETALARAGGLADTSAGWKAYEKYLDWQSAEGPAGKSKAYASMSRGWALGTKEFRTVLAKDHQLQAASRAWEVFGAKEIREGHCADLLARALRKLGKSLKQAKADRKSAPWKVAIAAHLKEQSQASNRWLSEQLNMGSPVAVSQYTGLLRRAKSPADHAGFPWSEKLKT
jgi:putative transposase